MKTSFEFDLPNTSEADSIRRNIRRRLEKLDESFDGIQTCHVFMELPYRHRYPGNVYTLKIEVVAPDQTVVVTRSPSASGTDLNALTLIQNAFNELNLKLHQSLCAKRISEEPIQSVGG